MRITNQTHYDTAALKRLILAVADREMDAEKRRIARFTICYSRKGYHTGCAFVGGRTGRLRIPKDPTKLKIRTFAMVIAHEIAHLHGMNHRQMGSKYQSWSDANLELWYSYADGYSVPLKAAKPVSPKELTPKIVTIERKLARCQNALKKHTAGLRRKQTAVKKWTRKVRYYEKQAAACRGQVVVPIGKTNR